MVLTVKKDINGSELDGLFPLNWIFLYSTKHIKKGGFLK